MGTELDDKGYALVKKALETSIKMITELQEDIAKLQTQRKNLRAELKRQQALCPLKNQSINFHAIQKVLDEN